MGFQSCESPNFKNFDTPKLEVPKQNDIWVLAIWLGTKNIIRGKAVASYILTLMGRLKKAQWITKHEVVIQINHVKHVNYIMVHAKAVVTQATSYDVLVKGVMLYPLGVTLDFIFLNYLLSTKMKVFLIVTFMKGMQENSTIRRCY